MAEYDASAPPPSYDNVGGGDQVAAGGAGGGRAGGTGWRRWVHLEWIRLPLGMLKLAEGALTLLSLIIVGSIRDQVRNRR